MPRSAKVHSSKSPDQRLAHHLEQAEEHLISAVEMFGEEDKPVRNELFVRRLTNTQETVTSLYREELVRRRGPFRVPRGKRAS